MSTQISLFERLGGEAAVLAAVDRFYAKVLADELVAPFFRDLNLEAQVRKQVAFMTSAFGGPDAFRGRDMREAHAKLVVERGLTHTHFDRILALLEQTLVELSIPAPLTFEVITLVGGLRSQVLGAHA